MLPSPNPQPGFGDAVRQLRKQKGVSQEALAHSAGLQVAWISEVERGKRNPTLANVKAIAAALEVRFSELAALTEEMDREY